MQEISITDPRLAQVNTHAAGIDLGSTSLFVALPPGPDGRRVREFGMFTPDLQGLVSHLRAAGITTVAMESTGVYWIPVFEILDAAGFEVVLADAHHVKQVSGRKSDVTDSEWLQTLHTFGLLRGAFRPTDAMCVLRSLVRQRSTLVEQRAMQIQHMQKALMQMNLHLHHVLSDVTGMTGMKILRAILAGERDPQALAQLRDRRVRADAATIAKALTGNYRREHVFALKQAVELYDVLSAKIGECEAEILREANTLASTDDPPGTDSGESSPPSAARKRTKGEDPTAQAFARLAGVDLTTIDGISSTTATIVLSEIGTDMTRWNNDKQFSAWLGLAPNPRISGGKRLRGRQRGKRPLGRAACALKQAAQALANSRSALGAFYRRLRGRIGPAKANKATAHKLARLIYDLLRRGKSYVDAGQQHYEQRFRERSIAMLKNRAKQFGLSLVPSTT